MKMLTHSPTVGIYPATSDYIHALEVRKLDRILFVSGTMGLDEHGVAGRTLDEQLGLIWSNIRTILASADMTVDNIVLLTSYLRDPAHAEANAAAARAGSRQTPHSDDGDRRADAGRRLARRDRSDRRRLTGCVVGAAAARAGRRLDRRRTPAPYTPRSPTPVAE